MPRDCVYERSIKYFLAPIQALMDDPDVSEIMINGPRLVYFEKHGCIHESNIQFRDEAFLTSAVRNIAEYVDRTIGGPDHSMDARLPDGSRVHVIVPPSSRIGTCLTIRRFKKSAFNLSSLVELNALTKLAAEFLEVCVAIHKNLLVSGGTGTGKTSMLNALSATISERERIVVIEDSSELQLEQQHTIYLETRPAGPEGEGQVTIRDLFVDSLRMRPDRIVVGEVRRGEALDLIQSMLSGHSGAMATVHASSAHDAASRLETLCLMSDTGVPAEVARAQVASALQVVVQLSRFADGSRRVSAISECLGLDERGRYHCTDIFQLQEVGRTDDGKVVTRLEPTGVQPSFTHEPYFLGYDQHVRKSHRIFQPLKPKVSSTT